MTLRLVALMSVVLLLCLAAFGLLVQHSQAQVMQEVAETASEVGRATLRTFELHRGAHWVDDPAGIGQAQTMVWAAGSAPERPEQVAGPVAGEMAVEIGEDEVDRTVAHRRIDRIKRLGPDGKAIVVTCESVGETATPDCIAEGGEAAVEAIGHWFVRIDDVRAESDPAQGLVLTIPRLKPDPDPGGGQAVLDVATVQGVIPAPVKTRLEEVRLPIPVGEFDNLFASIRDRSMFLFFGVFLVGMVLSAGLASRFTRPVRRLDAALRRLSEGDLDVEVDARGKDEIARLGRAFNDMTRKLRANRQRSRELVRREKLSALGRLAAGVAHDVRNPLHSIGLTLQHLRETGRPEDSRRAAEFDRSVQIIRGEIRRLDQLVGNFLSFANGDRTERQAVDLEALLQETARLIKKEAEWRNVKVELVVEDRVPPVPADGEALRSSILNLVLNSFEAMPDGGELTLALRRSGDEAIVEVADTGEGIPAAHQEKVFEFAYTTRDGGNGLGLAMVHQTVVEEHGGRVTLDSTPESGTRVSIALPVAEGAQA